MGSSLDASSARWQPSLPFRWLGAAAIHPLSHAVMSRGPPDPGRPRPAARPKRADRPKPGSGAIPAEQRRGLRQLMTVSCDRGWNRRDVRASSLRWQGAALLGPGTGGAGDFPENAGPAASPDGDRWDRPARRPPPGSAQGGVLPDELGTGLVPGARRLAEMGSAARGNV